MEGKQADQAGAELQRGKEEGPHGVGFVEGTDRIVRRKIRDVVSRQDPVGRQMRENGVPAGVRPIHRPEVRDFPRAAPARGKGPRHYPEPTEWRTCAPPPISRYDTR